jgi:MFS family permease
VIADTVSLRALRRVLALPGSAPLAALFFCHVLAFTHLESTLALFWCDRFGLTARETGYTFAFVGLVVAGMQGGAIGPLVRRYGERTLLRVGLAALAVGMLAIAGLRAPAGVDVSRCDLPVGGWDFVTRLGVAWAVLAAVSAGNALVMPNVSSLASKLAPAGQTGVVLGGQQSASSLARVIGPALAGVLYQRVGPGAPYVAAAVGMLLALALALRVRGPSEG